MKRKILSIMLSLAMGISLIPQTVLAEGVASETNKQKVSQADQASQKAGETSYAFASDSLVANEQEKENEISFQLTRSGDVSEASKMTLAAYDISAKYGVDYRIACEGQELPAKKGSMDLYTAFRENSLVGDYEEDSNLFVEALLSYSGLPAGENMAAGAADSAKDSSSAKEKNLKDADAGGLNAYNSVAALDNIGARSCETEISFAKGEKTKEITITVMADDILEYNEFFAMALFNSKMDDALLAKCSGIPDIPLKAGRDITTTTVTIENTEEKTLSCTVQVDKKEYSLGGGEETVLADFSRSGSLDTFSTVTLYRDGKAYGYFGFSPYQEVQQVKLGEGIYQIMPQGSCTLSGSSTVTVKGWDGSAKQGKTKKQAAKEDTQTASAAGADPQDLDTVYDYSAVPASLSGVKKTAGKSKRGGEYWFADWADNSGRTEDDDYITCTFNSNCMFVEGGKLDIGSFSYVSDPNQEHNGKNVYNTIRLNTSGSGSTLRESYIYADAKNMPIETTAIEAVESRYYVDDTDLYVELGVHNEGCRREKVESKGWHLSLIHI